MVRAREPEVEAARARLFKAAEAADRRLRGLDWGRALPLAFALGFVLARVPAARAALKGGLLWLLRGRVWKR